MTRGERKRLCDTVMFGWLSAIMWVVTCVVAVAVRDSIVVVFDLFCAVLCSGVFIDRAVDFVNHGDQSETPTDVKTAECLDGASAKED